MTQIRCSGTAQATAHEQYDALCDALDAALTAASSSALAVRFNSITPHNIQVELSSPDNVSTLPQDMTYGMTDTTLSPQHHPQFAAAMVGAARHYGLIAEN